MLNLGLISQSQISLSTPQTAFRNLKKLHHPASQHYEQERKVYRRNHLIMIVVRD